MARLPPMVQRGLFLSGLVAVLWGGSMLASAEPGGAPAKQAAPAAKGAPAKPAGPVGKVPLQPVGANPIMKLTAAAGFVDEVIAYDNQRVAYVIADTSTRAELHVVQLGCATCIEQKQEIVVDLSPITLRPVSIKLIGQRAFVVGTTEDGNQVAALVDFAKKAPVYKLGPAAHITQITRDGAQRVAVHKTTTTKTGIRHDIELVALETGKRAGMGKLELDKDYNKKLDFRVNHWSDGWTRISGLKGGEWIKKENQRSPDTEATFDLVTGKFVENKPIPEVVEQRKRYQVLADAAGQLEFLRMAWDNSAIHVWSRGASRAIEIDQPLTNYDPKSLQGSVVADGSAWLALRVDPVNADAVARKKADPEFLDIFRVDAGTNKATRKARIPAKDLRFKFGMIDGYVWLLERSSGFDRGGRNITIWQLQ